MSTSTSGRSELGKNCFCTGPARPAMASDQQAEGAPPPPALVTHAAPDQGAQAPIERRVVDGLMTRRRDLGRAQEHRAQIGREGHRHQPGDQQREGQHPEDIAGIFADAGLGETDGDETRRP